MQNALINRCGLTAGSATAVISEGFVLPGDFLKCTEKDIDKLCVHISKTVDGVVGSRIPFLSIMSLKTFRYWALTSKRIGLVQNPNHYTEEEKTFIENLQSERVDWHLANPVEPTPPPPLKDLAKWRTFWEKLDSFFTIVRGAGEIPLTYVYRPTEVPTEAMRDAEYGSNDERYYSCTILEGTHYKADNARVFSTLKTLTCDGPGWTFIRSFNATQDGRGAVLALRQQAEGDAATLTRKEQAYNIIQTTRFDGPRRNFTFSNYVEKHSNAHAELFECHEEMSESRKVSLFLDSITDTRLLVGKNIVIGDAVKSASFQATQSYLSALAVRLKPKAGTRDPNRNVSDVSTGKGRNTGKGKGKGDGKSFSKKGNLPLKNRYYSSEEWFNILDDSERAIVNKLKGKPAGGATRTYDGKRNASSVNKDEGLEEPETDNNGVPIPFGRDSHKKNKPNHE
jgi:hypothetical protein